MSRRLLTSDMDGVELLEALGVPTDNLQDAVVEIFPGLPMRVRATYNCSVVDQRGQVTLEPKTYRITAEVISE